MPFNFKPFGLAFGISLLISGGLYWQVDSFALTALPVAITIAAPQLAFALKKLLYYRHTGTQFSNSFAVLLLCNGLHFLDYPFLRPLPEMAIFGFGLVLIFSVGFAALLPTILSKYHTDRSDALIEEIQKRKQVEQELELAVNKAKRLANIKAEFLANMSHEIRTPLTGIMGLNDLLLTTELSTEQQEYCDDVRYASHKLRRIINNILSLSKLESGTIDVDREAFALQVLSGEIDKHYALNKSSTISIRYTSSETLLLGDKVKLQQVLFNLIDNAIKYSQGSMIDVRCTYDKATALLTLKVADDGIGIAPAIKAQLFDRFEQQHDQGAGAGVGLGLAIVKQLLAVMDGHISLESEMGNGATFTCKIPLAIAPEITTVATAATVRTTNRLVVDHSTHIQNDDRQYHILVIDDDPITLNTVSVLLEQAGYRCYLAEDGTTAKQLLTRHDVDVILSDIQLPDVEGVELIRYFREVNQSIPIIAHSAFAFDEDVAAAIAAGASDYLRKPATFSELQARLNACLDV
jgi:signal transduction histidine kinase/CheY-like chemotaxis protein